MTEFVAQNDTVTLKKTAPPLQLLLMPKVDYS